MQLFRSKSGRKTLYEYKTSKTYIGWVLKTATFYFKSIKILLTLRSAIVRGAKKSAGTHQNDFWVFSKMADRSFPGPLHFQDGDGSWRLSQISHPRGHCGCQNPYPRGASPSQMPVGCLPPPPRKLSNTNNMQHTKILNV